MAIILHCLRCGCAEGSPHPVFVLAAVADRAECDTCYINMAFSMTTHKTFCSALLPAAMNVPLSPVFATRLNPHCLLRVAVGLNAGGCSGGGSGGCGGGAGTDPIHSTRRRHGPRIQFPRAAACQAVRSDRSECNDTDCSNSLEHLQSAATCCLGLGRASTATYLSAASC